MGSDTCKLLLVWFLKESFCCLRYRFTVWVRALRLNLLTYGSEDIALRAAIGGPILPVVGTLFGPRDDIDKSLITAAAVITGDRVSLIGSFFSHVFASLCKQCRPRVVFRVFRTMERLHFISRTGGPALLLFHLQIVLLVQHGQVYFAALLRFFVVWVLILEDWNTYQVVRTDFLIQVAAERCHFLFLERLRLGVAE